MNTQWIIGLLIASGGFLWQCVPPAEPAEMSRPNVLFIAVDDLRPELGGYGQALVKSPHIDQLLASGITFERAYCNVPVCGASRASMLTGLRPGYNRFLHHYAEAKVEAPEVTTLPEHFKKHGYETFSVGKVFHTPADMEKRAWSEPPFRLDHHLTSDGTWSTENWQNYLTAENVIRAQENPRGHARPWEKAEVADTVYYDGQYAQEAIRYLKGFKESDTPFFLALGFLKPHLPFNAPKKYWDLYQRDKIVLADNPFVPENAPEQAQFNWGELRAYDGIPKEGPVSDSVATALLHGYYACVSYTDQLIGHVLNELKRLELDKNTLVVLWGDHGWNLGEHGFWCKHVNFETSLRTTLAISGPGVAAGTSPSIVELVDLYPTLLDYCQLPSPEHALQGVSIAPILENPNAQIKEHGLSQWMNGVTHVGDRYFYTEWHDPERNTVARMLYDHHTDPKENRNIAERVENATLVEKLSQQLRESLPTDYWEEGKGTYPGR